MRGMSGVLLFAGLVAGCGGVVEDAPDEATLTAAPSESGDEVTAMECNNNSIHYAQYFHINGVQCGLAYHYCDGRIYQTGCEGITFTEAWFCPCP